MAEQGTTPEFDEQGVREAALAAMKSAGLDESNWPQEEQEETPETEEVEEDEATSPAEVPEAGAGDTEVEVETDEAATSEVPTSYFGVDLSDLPSDKRQAVIDRMKEQDRYIQSIQRKAAELEKQAPTPEVSEVEADPLAALEQISDDDLLKELGYDPEDPMFDVKKEVAGPLARLIVQQGVTLQQMNQRQQEADFEAHWTSTLDRLESEHGELPITRDQLVDIALKNQIFDPEDAYNRVAMSGRSTLSRELEAYKAEAAAALAKKPKAKPPATTRPGGTKTAPASPKELLDPVAAALQAAKDTGIDWGETLKQLV